MKGILDFWGSSVGGKVAMAVTGFLLFAYVVAHMIGNLQVYIGQDQLNAYAAFLHAHLGLLWTARLGLAGVFAIHIWSSSRLTLQNQAARPVGYAVKHSVQSTLASRNMYLTGAMVAFFLIYHLGQFTLRLLYPATYEAFDALGRPDVYRMVVMSFHNPFIASTYIVAMLLLGLHLSHGVSSMFQSLGLNRPTINRFVNAIGPTAAIVIVIGDVSMPLAILAGLVKL
jgi:succinate dehydrogenase / fumarate reductase, cytochrome b subunit